MNSRCTEGSGVRGPNIWHINMVKRLGVPLNRSGNWRRGGRQNGRNDDWQASSRPSSYSIKAPLKAFRIDAISIKNERRNYGIQGVKPWSERSIMLSLVLRMAGK